MWTAVYSQEARTALVGWMQARGSSDVLRKMVSDTHGNGPHADDYMAAIAFVESHPGLARAKAKDR